MLEEGAELPEETASALLRDLHTLKGNAGMLGLRPMVEVVHAVEGAFRSTRGPGSRERLDALFEAAAALRHVLQRAGTDEQEAALARMAAMDLPARLRTGGADAPAPTEAARPALESSAERAEAPETAEVVRVPFAKLDRLLDQVGELTSIGAALEDVVDRMAGPLEAVGARRPLEEMVERLGRTVRAVRDSTMEMRLVPIQRVFSRFPSLARELAREQGKQVRVVLEGGEVELDKSTVDALGDPLLHLVRNAVDHGIRPPEEREAEGKPALGTIRLRAVRQGDAVRVEVADDGRGLDRAALVAKARAVGLLGPDETPSPEEVSELIFRPGFSTRAETDTVSGRGIGLDVVKRRVVALRGSLRVEEGAEGGTRFLLKLPLTLAILPTLLFEADGEVFALPSAEVEETLRGVRPERAGAAEVLRHRDEIVPVARAGRLMGWSDPVVPAPDGGRHFALVLRHGSRCAVLLADRLIDQRDLVVKALPPFLGNVPAVSGAGQTPDGRVVLLLDVVGLLELNLALHRRE